MRSRFTLFLRLALALALLEGLLPGGIGAPPPALAAGQPQALLSVPGAAMIGEQLTLIVSFDNAHASDSGYTPYVDLYLPATGVDGAAAAADDGLSFVGATYLGTPVIATVLTLASGGVPHPYARDASGAPLVIGVPPGFRAGDQVVVLRPPFGSFTPSQPPAAIVVTAALSNLADLDTALPVRAVAGFALGNDPLDNPPADPSIVQATPTTAGILPTIWTLKKTYIGPEDETASGPNYPRQYRVDVDIAAGQIVTDLDLSDVLPPTMQYVRVDSVTAAVGSPTVTEISTPALSAPGGTLTRRLSSATGTAGARDASLLFTFYVPRLDAAAAVVIDLESGDDVPGRDDARAAASWTPVDARDPLTPLVSDAAPVDHVLGEKSIAVQKRVSNVTDGTTTPGDVLEYTIDVQVSDFFAFESVVVVDTFSDGQRFDGSFPPDLQVAGNGYTVAQGPLDAANYTVAPNYSPDSAAPNDGTTTLTFRISDEIVTRGRPSGRLIGGCVEADGSGLTSPCALVPGAGDGPTTARIVFRTVIQELFSDTYPSGDPSVDQGDSLDNVARVEGEVLENTGLAPSGHAEDDGTGAEVVVARGQLSKTVYAVNGYTDCRPASCSSPVIQPGDTVTYRLRYDLPSSDIEDFQLVDYLPLPIFDVDDAAAPFVSRIASFDTTVSAAVQPAGTAKYGPLDTFSALAGTPDPTVSLDSTANSITFAYGDYDNLTSPPSAIDVLFTVTANDRPFADGLFLTNQVRQTEQSTNGGDAFADAIVQVKVLEPALAVRKGVIAAYAATDDNTLVGTLGAGALPAGVTVKAPGSCARLSGTVHSGNLGTTFNANLTNVDAGTRVTFAIVVENTGSGPSGAFDVRVRDALPAGLTFVPGSLCVADGAGAAIAYAAAGGGLLDPAGGIDLTDPGPTTGPLGGLDPGKDIGGNVLTNGHNIAIVTFDATVDGTSGPNQVLTNQATLYNYASAEGAPDFTAADSKDPATVTTGVPSLTKRRVATSEAHTADGKLAIGEIVRYRLEVRLPEGTYAPSLSLRDSLPAGLTFLDDDTARVAFVSDEGAITSSAIDGALPGCAGLVVTGTSGAVTPTCPLPDTAISKSFGSDTDGYASGDDVYVHLGDVHNGDDDLDSEYIVVEFNVVLDNSTAGSNDAGETRANNFHTRINNVQVGTSSNSVTDTIVEPLLTVAKTASVTSGDAGDTVRFTVVVANVSGATGATAFDVTLSDVLPAAFVSPTIVGVTPSGAVVSPTSGLSGNTVTLDAASIDAGASVTLVYEATLAASVSPGQEVSNTATARYTSLSGATGADPNPTGSLHPGAPGAALGERTSPGVAPNDYAASDTETLTVFAPDPQKTLVATSEAHTAGARVAVGEIVRYRLAVRLAEGTTPAFAVRDNLPAGARFLDDGTARYAFVSDNRGGVGIRSDDPDIDACADVAVTPATPLPCALPAGAIGGGPFTSGADPAFSFGTLTNDDDDPNEEYVIVELNALIENVAANQAGVVLDNTFSVLSGAAVVGSSSPLPVTVVEPNLTLVKRLSVTPPTIAGSSVSYDLTLTNASGPSGAAAYDIGLADVVDGRLTVQSVTLTALPAYASFASTGSGNSVAVGISELRPGDTATIRIAATLNGTSSGVTIPNTAALAYTSLPGANGTSANDTGSKNGGVPGEIDGERAGTGGVNDYSASDSEDMALGALGDGVWYDADRDGARDAGEEGIRGASVRLTWPGPDGDFATVGDNAQATALTDADGSYGFQGLVAGIYRVSVDAASLPAGLTTLTADPDGGALAASYDAALASAQIRADVDFGYRGAGALGDRVWLDTDGDGSQDAGEDGLGGIAVHLTWAGRDVTFGTDDDVTGSTVTAPDGAYGFANLPAGTFRVAVDGATLPGGVSPTYDPDGAGTSHLAQAALDAGQARSDVDFGYRGSGSIGDDVWLDQDGAGTHDADEPGLGAVEIGLTWAGPDGSFGSGDDIAFSATTDGAGAYGFAGLPFGEHRVVVETATLPAGIGATYDLDGALDSTTSLSLTAGRPDRSDADFGYRGSGSIGDRVWYDADGDGLQDPGEPGLPGVGVTVAYAGLDGSFGTTDDVTVSATSASDGSYTVRALAAGSYRADVDQADAPGGARLTTANDPQPVSLAAGESYTTADFGFVGGGSIGDRVWLDKDGDGTQDAGEPGIPGVSVSITWAGPDGDLGTDGDTVTYRTATDAGGLYSVAALPPGPYHVTVDADMLPAGLGATADLDGAGTAHVAAAALSAGQHRGDVDFGYAGAGSISQLIWHDADRDGSTDAGERGIGGVDVTAVWAGPDGSLGTADDVTFTAKTDAGGTYRVPHLPAGRYRVSVDPATLPPGMLPSYDPDGGDDGSAAIDLGPGESRSDANFGYALSPTAITLVSFTAVRDGERVVVRWETGAELGVWGFRLYRSSDGTRSGAVAVAASIIPAAGRRGAGESYRWEDAAPGARPSYWLEEVEVGGATAEYGPTSVAPAATEHVYRLPLVRR